jgi:hypothetical protein
MKRFTVIAVAVFSIVACLHFLRLLMGWEVSIAGGLVPMWASYVGLLLTAGLAAMVWQESSRSEPNNHADEGLNDWNGQLKKMRLYVTLGALSVALAHLLWPAMAIDAITLILVTIALVPWLAPIFKSLEFPGGWKVEFQELQKAVQRAEQIGLVAPSTRPSSEANYSFQQVVEQDPNLALAGLRIEIEKRLTRLAEKHGIEVRGRGLGQLLRQLSQRNILGQEERSVLADLTGLLNSAVHGASVDRRTAEWAMEVGPRILRALEEFTEGSS